MSAKQVSLLEKFRNWTPSALMAIIIWLGVRVIDKVDKHDEELFQIKMALDKIKNELVFTRTGKFPE